MRLVIYKSIILLMLSLGTTSLLAETQFKIITLQHRFANDLLPIISPMVGNEGTATGINNQLILRTSAERLAEIEAVIATLDVVRVNRKISVSHQQQTQTQQENTQATGAVRVGKVTVANDRRANPNSGQVDIQRNTSNNTRNSQQLITVLDGEHAFLRVGQIVPFTQEWVNISRRYVQIERFTDWHEITTGFAVKPRTIGNPDNKQIELSITPRMMQLNQHGYIDFEELTTVVNVTVGEWVDIANTMQQNDEVSRKILGFSSQSAQQKSWLSIKVD
jgi:hypothetical protein